jgi:hypothetical protein
MGRRGQKCPFLYGNFQALWMDCGGACMGVQTSSLKGLPMGLRKHGHHEFTRETQNPLADN